MEQVKKKEEYERYPVMISTSLHKKLKIYCAHKGISIKYFVENLILSALVKKES